MDRKRKARNKISKNVNPMNNKIYNLHKPSKDIMLSMYNILILCYIYCTLYAVRIELGADTGDETLLHR